MDRLRMAVFVSGRGSHLRNFYQKIREGRMKAEIVVVFSNHEAAGAVGFARDNGIPVVVLERKSFKTDPDYENAIREALAAYNFDVIALAGYLRILSADFIEKAGCPIFNIHPSLLPAFKGLHAQKQALEAGVKITGATCHLVNEDLDGGKILAQTALEVTDGDDEESLSGRLLPLEHELYWKTLELWRENERSK